MEVEVRSLANVAVEDGTTDRDGHYNIRIVRPGRYYLGINLNRSATRDTPYPRWFFPGVTDPIAATVIDFSGKPETRTHNFALPERQKGRAIEGTVLLPDGQPQSQARVAAFDSSDNLVIMEFADVNGRFVLPLFADVAYRIHAVWPAGVAPAISAVPLDIQPGSDPLTLHFILSQPGNTLIGGGRRGPGSQ